MYNLPLETPKDISEDPLFSGYIEPIEAVTDLLNGSIDLLLDILIDPQEAHID